MGQGEGDLTGASAGPRRRVACRSVGSKGSKPRKPKHSQHLPKVGTKTDNERLMHEEHDAILDTMGMSGLSEGGKRTVWAVGGIMLALAIVGLIILTVVLS